MAAHLNSSWRVAACLSSCAAWLGGCGSGSGNTDFTLTVLTGAQGAPLPGVAVALDQTDGIRREGTTGADGALTFPNVDVAEGPFAFTAALPGYVAVTDLGLTQPGGWTITLVPVGEDPSWADVSGAVLGKKDENDDLVVTTTVPSTPFEGIGPEYAIRVTPSEPFSVVVSELASGPASAEGVEVGTVFRQWAEFTAAPASGPVDLDLMLPAVTLAGEAPVPGAGQSLAPHQASGSFLVPAKMPGAAAYLRVTTEASSESAFLGGATSVTEGAGAASSGGPLDYTAEYVAPAGESLETFYWLSANGAYSNALLEGPPGVGEIAFLDPPSLPSPLPLYGPLAVTTSYPPSPSMNVSVAIERDDDDIVWRVYDEGAVALRLPKLPSAIDPRLILGTGLVSAVPELCSVDPATGRCALWATGVPADLVPQ